MYWMQAHLRINNVKVWVVSFILFYYYLILYLEYSVKIISLYNYTETEWVINTTIIQLWKDNELWNFYKNKPVP